MLKHILSKYYLSYLIQNAVHHWILKSDKQINLQKTVTPRKESLRSSKKSHIKYLSFLTNIPTSLAVMMQAAPPKKVMQQPGQKPCHRALTVKTDMVPCMGTRSYTTRLSHRMVFLFQLSMLIFRLVDIWGTEKISLS